MIFHDTLELNLKVGDKIKVMGPEPIETIVSHINSSSYTYNKSYTIYGFYYMTTQDLLFMQGEGLDLESLDDYFILFKDLLCSKLHRIIPI